ncbi:MAG TPA: class I SAM-dependent methyltransferase [Gemmatimonadaceae bacterium]|jgi:SAM-dependent methyltransferase
MRRTAEQLREHYQVERELADRLRAATREQRRSLYRSVYDELYRRVPHHPQLTRRSSPLLSRASIDAQLRLLRRFIRPDATFLEIGAGDCALAIAAADQLRQVYAIDVSNEVVRHQSLPANVELILSDATTIQLPTGSVDVAYSNQFIEHLHANDALEHLHSVRRTLREGGVYICATPNRLSGPHDISGYFDQVATGFHLKEYSVRELSTAVRAIGFSTVSVLLGIRGHFLRSPVAPFVATELALATLPRRFRQLLTRTKACRAFLGLALVATK